MSQAGSFITSGGSGGTLSSLTGNTGGPVFGDGSGNINVVGAGNITVSGNPGTFTETITITGIIPIANGGTNASSFFPNNGTIYFDGTQLTATLPGNAGDVLTSNGGALAPTYQATSASVTSITGNSGGAQTGAITLITANGTPTFVGAAGTITLDFGLSNLILGDPGSITIGTANTGYGLIALAATTSGSNNTGIGYEAMVNSTTSSNCTSIGAFSMFNTSIGADNNTAIGYGALGGINTGTGNTTLGYNSGGALTGTDSNNIMLGNIGSAGLNATIKIGTNATHTTCFIAGIDTVNVGSTATVVTEASDQLGTAVITAGTGISITPGANTITIAATGAGGFTWAVTTIDAGIVVNNGYIADKAGLLTMTLPATGAIGDMIRITGINTAVGWRIAQNANQQIFFGASSTTLGGAGYIEATAIRDSAELVCVVAGASTVWNVISAVGNLTIA